MSSTVFSQRPYKDFPVLGAESKPHEKSGLSAADRMDVMTTTPPSSSEKLGLPQSPEVAAVFKPFHFTGRIAGPRDALEPGPATAGGNMFGGVSPDIIIIGVMVVSAVVFIVWVNRR